MIMAMKYRYATREEIPADQAGLYTEREGAWMLDTDGVVELNRLEEVRSQNAALLKERNEWHERFAGIDPEEVRRMTEEKRKLEEAAQLKAGEVDKVIEARVRTVKGEMDRQLAKVTGERDALNQRLASLQIDQAVVGEATKRGLRSTATPDIMTRARSVFRLVNGMPTALEADGLTTRLGKDGMSPLSLAEWIEAQVTEAPHLFEANAGAGTGANGGASGASGLGVTGRNPFRKETWNLTEQMRLL
jgi:hypothetical protein